MLVVFPADEFGLVSKIGHFVVGSVADEQVGKVLERMWLEAGSQYAWA